MTLVLCPASHRGMIHKALNARADFVTDWPDVMNRARRVSCLVLDIDRLPGEWTERIRSLRARAPRLPIVLVLPLSTENAAPLDRLPRIAFVWREDVPERLRSAVVDARVDRDADVLLRRVRAMGHIRGKLREYVEAAITSLVPVRTTKRLAALVGKKESTIQDAWSRRIRTMGGRGPKDFLSALLAYRAVTLARSGGTPQEIAEDLGVSERTLERITHRAFGVTPSDLTRIDRRRAVECISLALSSNG